MKADTAQRAPAEALPLLHATRDRPRSSHTSPKHPTWPPRDRLVLLLMAVVLLISLGDQLMDTPVTRILEAVICYRYWEKVDPRKLLRGRDTVGPGAYNGVDEMYCKADAVQSELAALRGWQRTFDGFPSLILALPFGWLADRYGRKPFVLLSASGCTLQAIWIWGVPWFWQAFDIRVTWASTFFTLLGGGSTVLSTLFFVLLSDISTEEQRAGIFLRVSAFSLLANLLMPPLAAWLMRYNPWIPTLAGTALEISGLVLFIWMPETKGYKGRGVPESPPPYAPAREEMPAPPPDVGTTRKPIAADFPMLWFSKLRRSASFLTDDWRVPLLITPFLFHLLLSLTSQLSLQYLSKRYALTLSEATLVMTIRSAVTVLLLFVLLPYLSSFVMRRFHLSGQRKDLYLMRASQILVTIGWTFVGLSPNVPTVIVSLAIASLGQGAVILLRSFLTSLLPPDHIARVYTTISIIDTMGAMVGAPLLAGLFKRGMALGGVWVGLPFFLLGILAALFTVLMFSVGLRKDEDEYTRVNVDHDE